MKKYGYSFLNYLCNSSLSGALYITVDEEMHACLKDTWLWKGEMDDIHGWGFVFLDTRHVVTHYKKYLGGAFLIRGHCIYIRAPDKKG